MLIWGPEKLIAVSWGKKCSNSLPFTGKKPQDACTLYTIGKVIRKQLHERRRRTDVMKSFDRDEHFRSSKLARGQLGI